MEITGSSIGAYLTQAPIFLVWIVGIVIALVNLKKQSKISALVLVALVTLLVTTVASVFLQSTLPLLLHAQYGYDFSRISTMLGLIELVLAFLGAVAWGLLFWAIYGWRSSASSTLS